VKTGTVSAAEIRSERGRPLAARFWLDRHPAETLQEWQHRTALAREVDSLRQHLEVLKRRHPKAWAIVAKENEEKGKGQ
jgi:hypothetical protein